MSINERLYQIDQLLNDRRSVTFKEIQDRLEVSAATLKRDLAYMRDRLHAPIVFDKDLGGYRFENGDAANQYELPGLWFTAEEIYALLTMQQLLINLDSGGLLSQHIKPLQSRLLAMIDEAIQRLLAYDRRRYWLVNGWSVRFPIGQVAQDDPQAAR